MGTKGNSLLIKQIWSSPQWCLVVIFGGWANKHNHIWDIVFNMTNSLSHKHLTYETFQNNLHDSCSLQDNRLETKDFQSKCNK